MIRPEAIEWLKNIKEKYIHGGDDFYDYQRRTAIDYAIENLTEVVRCKDCKHYNQLERGCDYHGYYYYVHMDRDDFCSYGERKDNERKAD